MPSILLGDLNEWRRRGRSALRGLEPTFGVSPSILSFPSRRPIFALDRILGWPEGLTTDLAVHKTPLARRSSDHLPLTARVNLRSYQHCSLPRETDPRLGHTLSAETLVGALLFSIERFSWSYVRPRCLDPTRVRKVDGSSGKVASAYPDELRELGDGDRPALSLRPVALASTRRKAAPVRSCPSTKCVNEPDADCRPRHSRQPPPAATEAGRARIRGCELSAILTLDHAAKESSQRKFPQGPQEFW